MHTTASMTDSASSSRPLAAASEEATSCANGRRQPGQSRHSRPGLDGGSQAAPAVTSLPRAPPRRDVGGVAQLSDGEKQAASRIPS